MYITSDALFAFMKNNLFALIKFVSINKYFTSKQAAGSSPKTSLYSFRGARQVGIRTCCSVGKMLNDAEENKMFVM
jgi:hypothetical protein